MNGNEPNFIRNFNQFIKAYHFMQHKTLNRYGLYKNQPHILKYLEENPGVTQQELADEMKVTKATMGTSLRRMENAGFVMRVQDKDDGRCNKITITHNGVKALHDCQKDIIKIKNILFSKIKKEEEGLVEDIFKRLFEGLLEYKE